MAQVGKPRRIVQMCSAKRVEPFLHSPAVVWGRLRLLQLQDKGVAVVSVCLCRVHVLSPLSSRLPHVTPLHAEFCDSGNKYCKSYAATAYPATLHFVFV